MGERFKRCVGIIVVAAAAAVATTETLAQVPTTAEARLNAPFAGVLPRDGVYFVNESLRFTIDHRAGTALLRFEDDSEIFVLKTDPAPLGGRVLSYDTGEVAMRVASWGEVTLYTSSQPSGVPALRVGDGAKLEPENASLAYLRAQAAFLTDSIAKTGVGRIEFQADWLSLTNGTDYRDARRYALDAMRTAYKAVQNLAEDPAARPVIDSKVRAVRVQSGGRAGLDYRDNRLIVTYVTDVTGNRSSSALIAAIRRQLNL